MVAQRQPTLELLATRALPTGLMESTYAWDGEYVTYQSDPRTRTCSCGEAECRHLDDALDLLADHHCPACGIYSAFGALCPACVPALWPPMLQVSHEPAPGDVQLIVHADPMATDTFLDVQLLIGPDGADGQEVLDDHAYVAVLRSLAGHLARYVTDYEAAMAAEGAVA